MGTEKNLRVGVFFIDIIFLVIFVVGFYHFMDFIAPQALRGIGRLSWLILTYVASFTVSTYLFPSLIQKRVVKVESVITRVVTTCALMLLLNSMIILISRPYSHFPRTFLFYSMITYTVYLMTERLVLRSLFMHIRANKRNLKNVILIGNEPTVHRLYDILSTPIYGYNIVGTFYDGECTHEKTREKRLGGIGDIYSWLANHTNINEIYGYFPKEQLDNINMLSKFCDNHLMRFYYIPAIDVFKGSMTFTFREGVPIVARREEPLRSNRNKFFKRTFDLIFSLVVLVTIFPWIWLLVAIMIKIQSPGPVFFVQERTGLDGKIFKCIKFRSMRENDDADTVQATKDDPRKFPFGDFMRKTNIDELPQFVNVLLGDMSVVGPRPHMLKHTAEYSKLVNRFMVRHFAKPGITGLAQVSGFRGETRYIEQMEGRVRKDIEYIENWTFLLDLQIILKTITNMFGKEKGNAY